MKLGMLELTLVLSVMILTSATAFLSYDDFLPEVFAIDTWSVNTVPCDGACLGPILNTDFDIDDDNEVQFTYDINQGTDFSQKTWTFQTTSTKTGKLTFEYTSVSSNS